MLVEVSRLLQANRVNERVSAIQWPLDHPFYCLTNCLCLCHLTAQRPLGQGRNRGRQEEREERCLIAEEEDGNAFEGRAANL